jgi:hypothetical protein
LGCIRGVFGVHPGCVWGDTVLVALCQWPRPLRGGDAARRRAGEAPAAGPHRTHPPPRGHRAAAGFAGRGSAELRLTRTHPVPLWRGGSYLELPAEDVRPGDVLDGQDARHGWAVALRVEANLPSTEDSEVIELALADPSAELYVAEGGGLFVGVLAASAELRRDSITVLRYQNHKAVKQVAEELAANAELLRQVGHSERLEDYDLGGGRRCVPPCLADDAVVATKRYVHATGKRLRKSDFVCSAGFELRIREIVRQQVVDQVCLRSNVRAASVP